MANPVHHAMSSAKKWGGDWQEYHEIHAWFDQSKAIWPDARHRAVRHHAEGIFVMEKFFGPAITLSTGRVIPTRWIGEQHCQEDFGGFIPTLRDWFRDIDDSVPEDLWPSVSAWLNAIEMPISIYSSVDSIVVQRVMDFETDTAKLYRWLGYLKLRPWMARGAMKLSEELEQERLAQEVRS